MVLGMQVRERLNRVRDAIDRTCRSVDRNPSEVTLIAISKSASLDQIGQAYEAGQRHFGESRLQDAKHKIQTLPKDICWHFVGPLQSNKAAAIAESFQFLHSLCNERQLAALNSAGHPIEALIQVNIAQEIQKSGIFENRLDEYVQKVLECKCVRLRGLMTIGPVVADPEDMRPFFQRMKVLLKRVPQGNVLSMGMSNDFQVALQEGATHIRVGSAIFEA